MADTGFGDTDADESASRAAAESSGRGRPASVPTLAQALEIVSSAIYKVHELTGGGVDVERCDLDGAPAFRFRGCRVMDGKLVIDR
jgi:hypothetical protein